MSRDEVTCFNNFVLGIEGFIRDELNKPMRNATLRISDRFYDITKNKAYFKIMLPEGKYTIEVTCHGYINATYTVDVKTGKIGVLNIVLKTTDFVLTNDSNMQSGIQGYVKDNYNHPIANADITIVERNITVKSDSSGKYSVATPPGTYTLTVTASGYHKSVKYFSLDGVSVVMLTLVKDSTVWGLPRLAFVIIMGFGCFGALGIALMCYVACRRKNDYGLLSQNAYFEDFKDFDESKEKELFTRPLPG